MTSLTKEEQILEIWLYFSKDCQCDPRLPIPHKTLNLSNLATGKQENIAILLYHSGVLLQEKHLSILENSLHLNFVASNNFHISLLSPSSNEAILCLL